MLHRSVGTHAAFHVLASRSMQRAFRITDRSPGTFHAQKLSEYYVAINEKKFTDITVS